MAITENFHGMGIKEKLAIIFNAAVAAVSPARALNSVLQLRGNELLAGDKIFSLAGKKIFAVAAGKGAAPMAQALENLLGSKLSQGFAVVKYGHALPLKIFELAEASHPTPDEAGEKAARKLLNVAEKCGANDILLVLLTGGASALLSLPAQGITLADLAAATTTLLKAGADIGGLNTIRKHLSAISGGHLALAAQGQIICVIISDVIGDDLSIVASGPTTPDESTFADCLEIINRHHLENTLPPAVMAYLRAGAAGMRPETPKSGNPCFARVANILAASNAQALMAAATTAKDLGFAVLVEKTPMTGEARAVAKTFLGKAKKIAALLKPEDAPVCFLAGGETTVTVKGAGLGGRNQEMALAASLEIAENENICALFAGTDGTDGPTDAAGGYAMAGINRAEALASLANNDSYNFLRKTGNLFITGPTLTNVMDLAIILIYPPCADRNN